MSYDQLNRLTGASSSSGPWNTLSLGWVYDPFGDRTSQSISDVQGAISLGVPPAQPVLTYSGNNNRLDNYGPNGYDASGNVLSDGINQPNNQYQYDAEGRICAVASFNGMMTVYTQYLYDAEGRRVAKGTTKVLSCDTSSTGMTQAEFSQSASYILGQSGEQISELDGSGTFQRSHVYANGQLLATYANGTTLFPLGDWLGTKRAVAGPNGQVAGNCMSLPFGDILSCNGTATLNGHHFTGQIHDQESGNDYFGARYYGSNAGRFTSPDPILQNDLRLLNPQRWNKYSYAINNPLTLTDPTGKDAAYVDFSQGAGGAGHAGLISIRSDGTATYSAFLPGGGGQAAAYAPGFVQTQDLSGTVQFGANGLPTPASYDSLIQQAAQINGSNAYDVGIDYFKTTDAETANLDEYIVEKTAAYRNGQAPTYKLCLYDCRDYALGGLVAAGVIGRGQAHGFSLDPNSVFYELNVGIANQQVPPEPKATVTASECDTLPDGTQRCQ